MFINSILATVKELIFFNPRINSTCDPDHPQELVDIISTVIAHSSKNDQNIIDVKFLADLESIIFITSHGQTYSCYMSIVPSIIIDQDSPIRKSSNLVTIIPP